MQVQHEVDQRPLQHGARAPQHVEARARESRARLEIQDAELLGQVPVRQRLEVEARGSPHVRRISFSESSLPSGTRPSGRFGIHASALSRALFELA